MDDDLKRSVTTGETWIRLAFILLFAMVVQVVELLLAVIAIVQWLFLLFTRAPSDRLRDFGDDLTVFNYQIWQYMTQNSNERPWPFAPWPYSTEGLDNEGPESVASPTPAPAAPSGAEPATPAEPPAAPVAEAEPEASEAPEEPASRDEDPKPAS